MDEVFTEIYINRNLKVKIHGLRMLDVRVLGMYPFASADSTNVAVNVPKTESDFLRLPTNWHVQLYFALLLKRCIRHRYQHG